MWIWKLDMHVEFPQPVIIIRGNLLHPRDAFIVAERQIICQLPFSDIPFGLLSAFYVFNMQDTYSCNNFYSFLDYYFTGRASKRSRLQHFITSVSNV